ncbi:prolyl aminopeptidase [Planctobacterium marinum]|uniref:prolyl aminopeptidase n=1 Tax=Planctobacterium marinum TaxID=1631968 RepID=UPI001E6106B0|nr:prolyl aminopeptidase [Planctobacterium marinum]MCC2606993.1 prolyl aminopeptidase [Planctobacterium marinum]
MKTLFPAIEPYSEGKLQVSDLHEIHYEQVGNPEGQAALFLHGGPGLGILPIYRHFFDASHYRIVLPDQRGAGRSKPYAELKENDTRQIVEDLEKLRKHLAIDKWLVMGGSWGSLLALCYAIKYPDSVSSLVLRGVFLGRQTDLDWVYGGTGTAQLFPDKWAEFKAPVNGNDDAEIVAAYYQLLTHQDPQIARAAALTWASYGANTMTLIPGSESSRDITASDKMLSLARTECHFAHHKFFLEDDNYVLQNADKISHIPTHIVHGRYDVICPLRSAWDIHQSMPDSQLHIVEGGAHIPTEPGMVDKLVAITEQLKAR